MATVVNNNVTQLIQPKPLSTADRNRLQETFDIVSLSNTELKKIYEALFAFFDVAGPSSRQRITEYYTTYWEWYVRATWQLLLSLPPERVVTHIVTQLPTAFRLNLAVEDGILYYIYRRCVEEKDMTRFFQDVQTAFASSNTPVNPANPKSKAVTQVMEEYKKMDRKRNTLELSNFYAKIENELFPRQVTVSEDIDKAALTKAFLEFLIFINDTKNIADVVVEYIESRAAELDIEGAVATPAVPVKPPPSTPPRPPQPKKEKASTAPPSAKTRPSYQNIKAMIDARFPKDDSGQYVNIDGVLALLSSLAADYKDDHIAELYYFDEEKNGFVWEI